MATSNTKPATRSAALPRADLDKIGAFIWQADRFIEELDAEINYLLYHGDGDDEYRARNIE
jgi:hypothetical protein